MIGDEAFESTQRWAGLYCVRGSRFTKRDRIRSAHVRTHRAAIIRFHARLSLRELAVCLSV